MRFISRTENVRPGTECDAFGNDSRAEFQRTHSDQCKIGFLYSVRCTTSGIPVDHHGDLTGRKTLKSVSGRVAGHGEPQCNTLAGNGAVGEIFDKFRPEEIIPAIAQLIGNVNAGGVQRIDRIAHAGRKIGQPSRDRINLVIQERRVGKKFYRIDKVRSAGSDGIGYLRFLRIFLVMDKLVRSAMLK